MFVVHFNINGDSANYYFNIKKMLDYLKENCYCIFKMISNTMIQKNIETYIFT